ncbi:MAG TPA: hypothetical protein VNY05_33255 [Candidatus Acidoferrales bacterium]|nr:hypothetical protein [Candidatus Acidoferrales bacterium]
MTIFAIDCSFLDLTPLKAFSVSLAEEPKDLIATAGSVINYA